MKAIIFVLFTLNCLIYSQTIYNIPFASSGNEIELEVYNDSEIDLNNVSVTVFESPSWISIITENNEIQKLNSKENGIIKYTFDLEKEAKILEESSIKFQIKGKNQDWNKEIKIKVLPPDKFELNQNYPNPFNPSTTLSYLIPGIGEMQSLIQRVKLTVYDILGREVENIVNEDQKPGFYKLEWNANHLASGMYIYQLSIENGNSKHKIIRKKMLLMK